MFESIIDKILPFAPEKIILFGSQAKGTARSSSDIDLCIVIETKAKRRLAAELQTALECDKAVDLLIYTPEEWKICLEDELSFAHKLQEEGIVLYGRQ